MRYPVAKLLMPVSLASILLLAAPASAFDMFDIDAPAIGENLSGGRLGNTNNWPADILQAIKADQIQVIEKMEQSGFSCWNVLRTVEGKVIDIKVKKGFFERLWDGLLSFLKRLFGIAANKIDFSGSDVIFGPPCSCPPPPFEKDPVTGKSSVVKIFGIFVDDLKYKKRIEAEVEAAFTWDFLGEGWNCSPGNPEGSRDPDLSTTPLTLIPASLRNLVYPESLIARDQQGQLRAGEKFSGGKRFQFEAAGSPKQITKKAENELQTYRSETDEDDDFIDKLIEKYEKILLRSRPLEQLLNEHVQKLAGSGSRCEQKVERAFISDSVAKKAFDACSQIINEKFGECVNQEGWQVDVNVAVKDLTAKPEQEESHEVVCTGGCPGKGAGDKYPLKIKSEFVDIQRGARGEKKEVSYEIVCSATCFSWKCGLEPPSLAPVPVTPKPLGEPAPAPKSEPLPAPQPPPAPQRACDLKVFEPCANKCESPQDCVKRCPFLPVPCPAGTPPDVTSCAELDQNCSYGCLNTANACINACLKLSNCTMEEIPPSLRPASNQKPPQ